MTSLSKYISDYFDVKMDSHEFLTIYADSLKYLTKAITASELHKRLKKFSSKSIKIYRLQLTNEGYYLLNVKMLVIHAYTNKRNPKWDLESEMKSMGIMKRDRKCLPLMLGDAELREQVKAIIFQLGGRKMIPTIAELKDMLTKVILAAEIKLRPLINNLLWTKLKFLIECGSVDFESVKCELRMKIIQTFYWLAPYRKENVNHWVMSMIKPIKNHATNLIKFYTTQKRTRMIEVDGKYIVVETSVDTREEDKLGDLGKTSSNIEARITAKQIFDRYCITEKRIKAFKLMAGVFDEGFTEWLREEKHIAPGSPSDNTDLQESIQNRYFLRLVAKYVKLNWLYFKKLISRIKTRLQTEGGHLAYGKSKFGSTLLAA